MKLTFEQESVEFMLDALELGTDTEGYVTTKDGQYAAVSDGRDKLHKDEIGVFEHDEDYPQDTLLVPDTFPEIVDHAQRMEERDVDEEAAEEAVEEFLTSITDMERNRRLKEVGKRITLVTGVLLLIGSVVYKLFKRGKHVD